MMDKLSTKALRREQCAPAMPKTLTLYYERLLYATKFTLLT